MENQKQPERKKYQISISITSLDQPEHETIPIEVMFLAKSHSKFDAAKCGIERITPAILSLILKEEKEFEMAVSGE